MEMRMRHRVALSCWATLALACVGSAGAEGHGEQEGRCRTLVDRADELLESPLDEDASGVAGAALDACGSPEVSSDLKGEAAVLRAHVSSAPWEEQLGWIEAAELELGNSQVRSLTLARVLEKRAELELLLGRARESVATAEASRELRGELFGEPSRETLAGDSFLAHAHLAAAQLERAEDHRRQALAILEASATRVEGTSLAASEEARELRAALEELRRDPGEKP